MTFHQFYLMKVKVTHITHSCNNQDCFRNLWKHDIYTFSGVFSDTFEPCDLLILQRRGERFEQKMCKAKKNSFRLSIWAFPPYLIKIIRPFLLLLSWHHTGHYFLVLGSTFCTISFDFRDRPLQLWNFLNFFHSFLMSKRKHGKILSPKLMYN